MKRYFWLLNAGFGIALAATVNMAQAESEVFNIGSKPYRDECGSCHVAYPPQLLPGASWNTMMGSLDKHFGTDASLDAEQARVIREFLLAHAGRRGKGERSEAAKSGQAPLRITETGWFRHEHDEVPAQTWKKPAVKSPANCAACHQKADAGDYSERSLRLPK